MGQYYDVFNLTKEIFIRPEAFGGSKLGEMQGGYLGIVLIGLLAGRIPSSRTCEVDWCGDAIAIVHDETTEWEELRERCRDVTNIVLDTFQEDIEFERIHRCADIRPTPAEMEKGE